MQRATNATFAAKNRLTKSHALENIEKKKSAARTPGQEHTHDPNNNDPNNPNKTSDGMEAEHERERVGCNFKVN